MAMPVVARRVFRVSLTTALALALAYAMAFPLPYMAPIFALVLTLPATPPIGLKSLFGLILVVMLTLGIGLLLIPLFLYQPVSAVLIVAVGLYFSTYLTVHMGKALAGTMLTIGFTLIPAAGTYDFSTGVDVIQGLTLGIGLAIVCQWVVYPWFSEDPAAVRPAKPAPTGTEGSSWIALRVTLIVLPPFLVAMVNPSMYLKLIMKSVALGHQGSAVSARKAGRELLGSTFLGGFLAILFWFMLDLITSLWMFFWWMSLFFVYIASKFYVVMATRFSPSFWHNVGVTMLILLGSAVEDSDGGDDVYSAFALRMGLFVAVTLYAWGAVYVLEQLRTRRLRRRSPSLTAMETH